MNFFLMILYVVNSLIQLYLPYKKDIINTSLKDKMLLPQTL